MTDGEVGRYRTLGTEAGRMLGGICSALTPGDDERDISRAVIDGAAAIRARAIVSLVGSDERLRRYRHPVPTATAWKHVVMVALCAERDGLVVSLSRDRKSTRLNSSHQIISYAVFCLKKKTNLYSISNR